MLRWIFTNWSTNKELHFKFLRSPPPPLPRPPRRRRASSAFRTRRLVDEILPKLNVSHAWHPRTLPSRRLTDTSIIVADADGVTPAASFSFFDHA